MVNFMCQLDWAKGGWSADKTLFLGGPGGCWLIGSPGGFSGLWTEFISVASLVLHFVENRLQDFVASKTM